MSFAVCSHAVNILVAGFFGFVLWRGRMFGFMSDRLRLDAVYGADSYARSILACVYLSIAIFSVLALLDDGWFALVSVPLFSLQILYKLLTFLCIRRVAHPVVMANICISLLHATSLWVLLSKAS